MGDPCFPSASAEECAETSLSFLFKKGDIIMTTLLRGCVYALTLLVVFTSAQENAVSPFVDDNFGESFVEESPESPMEESPTISRECFQRSCYTAYGHSECQMKRMECHQGSKAPTEWLLAEPNRLVAKKTLSHHVPGLLDIVQHKHAINPNGIITMPGIPAKAPKGMATAMKEQDAMLKKVLAMEKREAAMDPLHKKARANWLHLAHSIQHMPPGPVKLKNEHLLMKLARNLAVREMAERKKLKSIMKQKKALEKKLVKAGGHAALRKAQRGALKKMGVHVPQKAHGKEINGIPVGHRKCFERACLRKSANGSCAAVVITCGHGGKAPTHTSKLSRKAAYAKVKSVLKRMGMSRNVAMKKAGEAAYDQQMFLYQQEVREDDGVSGPLLHRMRENEDIAQEESERMFEESLHE